MNALKRLRNTSLIFAAAALLICSTAAFTQEVEPGTTKEAILVHGAWADGSSWSKVIPLLEQRGFHVVAVQLPLTSLANDVATVRRAIALETGPVLLVAHSCGGVVITEAGNDPKVSGLVYISAYAPDAGESAFTLNTLAPASPASNQITKGAEGFLKLNTEGILADFAQDLPLRERTTLLATQGPISASALGASVSTSAWRTKPSWFIIASRDRTIEPQLEELEAKRMNAVTTTADSCHVVMLSQPELVANVIVRASHALDSDRQ
ncbi:putative signal peptide protein [Acidisarcina polymorpha]|uniref:Putative signal peptide protein n=1 Tax=Acidisarcina polymorpha TaxID=2211140 RepID=A0A2Z5G559_9BACT|nr:alpha/beta hydrolase [Acidisarcina polymorpha]AXC14110.1 putative signal peptide protein [Acidisarcina polymorpha]